MAQEVRLQGRTYSDVPSILLPDSNNVFHPFTDVSDTTATASDVASGKYFYLADGTKTQGTSSGGGASNIVMGTFTTGSTRNTTGTFNIAYTGTGYPIAMMVFVKGGVYNDTASGNTSWYNSKNRYDVGAYYMTKSRQTSAPTYATSGADNYGAAVIIYKNSTTNATSYSRTSAMVAVVYNSSDTNAVTSYDCIRFKGNGKTVSYFVGNRASSAIGLVPSTEYQYIVIYSS